MIVVYLLLLIAGLVCFVLAASNRASRVNLVAAGLACWIAVDVLQVLVRLVA